MFSEHFKLSLKSIGAIVLMLVATFFWMRYKIHDVIVPPQIILPKNDVELISYNENSHITTVTTPEGTTQSYSRNPTVEIRKDGTVKVNNDAWGGEVRPFLGIGYSDTARTYAGCNLFYFHRFDAAASFGLPWRASVPLFQPMLSVGYNFYSNTSINAGVNPLSLLPAHKQEIAVFLSVRL